MQSRFKDWGDVRVFLAVMLEGATPSASRHLEIDQTTVSRCIDVHELALDARLFDRTTRGAAPTERATALMPFAESLEQAASSFEVEVVRDKASGSIRITALEIETFGDIGAIISEFTEKHPDVSFEYVFQNEH